MIVIQEKDSGGLLKGGYGGNGNADKVENYKLWCMTDVERQRRGRSQR